MPLPLIFLAAFSFGQFFCSHFLQPYIHTISYHISQSNVGSCSLPSSFLHPLVKLDLTAKESFTWVMDLSRHESWEQQGIPRSSFDTGRILHSRRNSEKTLDFHHSSVLAGASFGKPPTNPERMISTDPLSYGQGKFQTVAGSSRHHSSQTLSPRGPKSQDEISMACRSLSWLALDNSYHDGKHSTTLTGDISQAAEKQEKAPHTSFRQSFRNVATSSTASLPRYWLEASNSSPESYQRAKQGGSMEHGNIPLKSENRAQLEYLPFPSLHGPLSSELVAAPSSIGLEQSARAEVVDSDSDELSSELDGELELEAVSTMDVSCHSYSADVADYNAERQLAIFGGKDLIVCDPRPRNLSQKYRPKAFQELVGQNIVFEALSNAIQKGKIAPAYLFQGSRGTGKTSAARIFAAALNCLNVDVRKPCWLCPECTSLVSGNSLYVKEADAASNNGIEKVKALLESTISDPSNCRYKVFIIDECHMLTTETWNALLKILEEPPMDVVFILITTDPDQLPRTAVSRCQKFPFLKIKDSEIVSRLKRLADLEQIEIVPEALELIASRSDGSLRDAETILDQLSLFGHKITLGVVHELVGCVSNEKVVRLLNSALLGDTGGTMQKARELIDSGVEPLSLMTQLATVITDMLSDSNINKQQDGDLSDFGSYSHEKLERLRKGLKILSESEKQVRASHDRTTWFLAALVQLGPDNSFGLTSSLETANAIHHIPLKDVYYNNIPGYENHFRRHDTVKHQYDHASVVADSEDASNKGSFYKVNRTSNQMKSFGQNAKYIIPSQDFGSKSPPNHVLKLHKNEVAENSNVLNKRSTFTGSQKNSEATQIASTQLDFIWVKALEACPSLPLRHLLQYQGKLLSISISEGEAVACLEFIHPEYKSKAERSRRSIVSAFQAVLGFPVEIRISLASLPVNRDKPRSKFLELTRQMQDHPIHNKNNSAADINGFISERSVLDSYSLHSLIDQERVYPHFSEPFPSTAQSHASVKDEQHFESAASDRLSSSYWNSAPPSGSESEKNCGQYINATVLEEPAESNGSQKAEQLQPFLTSDCDCCSRGSPVFEVPLQGHEEMVESSMQISYDQYMNGNFGGNGPNLLQNTLVSSLKSDNLQGVDTLREYPHSFSTSSLVLKPENASPDPHGLETNSGKKMRRMAIKNRFKSFAKTEKKSFSHSPHSIDEDANCQVADSHSTAAYQKKGRFLGAAESIARLFLNK